MAPRPPLTRRQAVILDAIRTTVADRGYPPTIRELCGVSGLTSTSSVAHQLRQLEQRGYIERREHGSARGLTVLDPEPEADQILRSACRELINASLGAITDPSEDATSQIRLARAWDAMALALDAAEDARHAD